MKKTISFFLLLLFLSLDSFAYSDDLHTNLSQDLIKIDHDFHGINVNLFGSKPKSANVVVILEGGDAVYKVVKKKRNKYKMWINDSVINFTNIPNAYMLVSDKPFDYILPHDFIDDMKIGINNLDFTEKFSNRVYLSSLYAARTKLIEHLYKHSLLTEKIDSIKFGSSGRLFKATFFIPDAINAGSYTLTTYLIGNNLKLYSVNIDPLIVIKTGIIHKIDTICKYHRYLYTIISITISLGISLFMHTVIALLYQRKKAD